MDHPTDALELLDRTVAQLNGPRQVHVQLQEAVECLRIALSGLTKGDRDASPDTN